MSKPTIACGLVSVLAAAAGGLEAAEQADAEAIRTSAGLSVCTVTVENAWGVPQSLATGWLLGEGGFVITDLGAIRHRGAARATVGFEDGSTATAERFGMAEPGLGLAALRVEASEGRKGLALASDLSALSGSTSVTMAGYDWGDRLEVKRGRLRDGPQIQTVAVRSGVKAPAGPEQFLRVEGERLHAASGSPVLDAAGRVLAVRLDVDAKGLTSVLAVPATALRSSLLSSTPELKPLSELPEPRWPVRILRLPGEPVGLQAFVKASQTVSRAMVCQRCGGAGTVRFGAWGEHRDFPCPACVGTGWQITPEVLDMLNKWAEEGTRVAWAAEVETRSRSQVRKIGVEMVSRLAAVGRNLRRVMGPLGRVNTAQPTGEKPEGVILYARVEQKVDGPDGDYLLLDAFNMRTPAAVRVEDLLGHDGMGPLPGRRVPAKGTWFALAATVVSGFKTGETEGVYVLPFEWAPYVPAMGRGGGEDGRRGGPGWGGRGGRDGPGGRGGPGGWGGGDR